MFCFVAEGRLLALTGYNAMFHAVLAFLLYHKAKYNGALGVHYIQVLLIHYCQLACFCSGPRDFKGLSDAAAG